MQKLCRVCEWVEIILSAQGRIQGLNIIYEFTDRCSQFGIDCSSESVDLEFTTALPKLRYWTRREVELAIYDKWIFCGSDDRGRFHTFLLNGICERSFYFYAYGSRGEFLFPGNSIIRSRMGWPPFLIQNPTRVTNGSRICDIKDTL